MKQLNLKFNNLKHLSPTVKVDDTYVRVKKNEFGNYTANFSTEKDEVTVYIYRFLEISGKLWFLMQMLFFIISIFGLLDIRLDKHCIVLDCSFKIRLKDSENNFTCNFDINEQSGEGEALKYESNCEVETLSNAYFVDKKAKKRRKFCKSLKATFWVVLVIIILIAVL